MTILHVIWGMPQTSGVSTFCAEVAAEQARMGHRVVILNDHDNRCPVDSRVERVIASTMDAVGVRPDMVHVHAFWSGFAVRVMLWCLRHHVPYVVSPHGGLMPRVFTVGRVKKWLAWLFVLRPLLNRARAIHCTSETEQIACLRLGVKTACFVAPLGVRLPERCEQSCEAIDNHVIEQMKIPYVLFVGRLSEEKGLVMLLDAWKRIKSASRQVASDRLPYRLMLVGPDWRGYRRVLEAKIAAEEIPDVVFYGPAEGAEKTALYRQASLFVLPSPMENFSMVVLEALAFGIPVIATKGTPWQVLAEVRCGWWIEANATALQAAMSQALSLSVEERHLMGARAAQLASTRFQWRHVARGVLHAYGQP